MAIAYNYIHASVEEEAILNTDLSAGSRWDGWWMMDDG